MTNQINEEKWKLAMLEIKLHINRSLYEQGAITQEMFAKAKEFILKS